MINSVATMASILSETESTICGLSPVQRAEMMACIHTAIEDLRLEVIALSRAGQKKTQRPQTPLNPALHPAATPFVVANAPVFDAGKANTWESSGMGYFLPDSAREEHMRMVQDSLYFSNALAFVTHIRALTAFKNENTIRLNLHSCLRGEALEWFMSELSECDREKLRGLALEEGWIASLMERFKTRPSHALKTLKKSKYNWADVRSQRSLVMWAHAMLRVAQESNEFPETWQQLHAVWDQIEIPIRGNVQEPSFDTTIGEFMEELDGWYNLWR